MARHVKEEPTHNNGRSVRLISAVEELSELTSQELNKLLKKSENSIIQYTNKKGSLVQIDMERLAWSLPVHLIALLVSSDIDEMPLMHFLRGIRLLHSLSDLASRHTRLEQILLDEVKISEQILDLVFYILLVLARYGQEDQIGACLPLLHSTLVACSLHLLLGYISSQWQDLVPVLLAHPKVDLFMEVAFEAVHVDIRFLHINLSSLNSDVLCNKPCLSAAERTVNAISQQCEASLQFVMSLCQQKSFRDRILTNKELCKNGGILSLSQSILNLNTPPCLKECSGMVSAISRMKSKVLSILLQLCEAESVSYLDEVAGSPKSMSLAKDVVLEILDLLKAAFSRETKKLSDFPDRGNPKGLVLLNSMRLADIFSDDSNFRSFFMTYITQVLVEILAIPHDEFLSSWCSTDVPIMEEDANLEYDPFMACGAALTSLTDGFLFAAPATVSETNTTFPGSLSNTTPVYYAQQRTSYLVKIIANLHCFVPNICEEEEKDLFLNKFIEYMRMESSKSSSNCSLDFDVQMDATILKNLCSLSVYVASLIPNLLNEEDVQLLSVFYDQLSALIPTQSRENSIQEHLLKDAGHLLDRNTDSHLMQQGDWARLPKTNFIGKQQIIAGTSFHDVHQSRSDGRELAGNDGYHSNEDAQSSGRVAPFSLRKSGASAPAQGTNKDDSLNIKEETSESSMSQEVDQSNGTCKLEDLLDVLTEMDESEREDQVIPSRMTSGSLRGIEKDILKGETGDLDVTSPKENPGLILGKGEFSNIPEYAKESELTGVQEDDKAEAAQGEEKLPRKRKRNIMNEKQIALIEKALLEEPEMQRNAPLLQSWADKLSLYGSEITSSQLKNWLNNRKARLARAAREVRGFSEGENSFLDKSCGASISHYYDSQESGGEEFSVPSTRGSGHQSAPNFGGSKRRTATAEIIPPTDFVDFAAQQNIQMNCPRFNPFEPGQLVSLVDAEGKEVGKGEVYHAEGSWHGKNLDEAGLCVVTVAELKVERWRTVQHPSEAAGTTFEEAEAKNGGVMRVAWDTSMIFPLPQLT